MTKRLTTKFFIIFLGVNLMLPLWSAETPAGNQASATTEKPAKPFRPIFPGPTDGPIACLTARMLEQLHYLKQPFDRTVSRKFLDRYLESLDPQHMHFTQADLAQFEPYGTTLGDLTINSRNVADTRPACEIFNRFMERLQQRVAYCEQLLKTEKFTFDGDDRITLNRKDLPYPKDLDGAKQLWRERLRFEYLQERLGKLDSKKKPDASKKTEAKPKSEGEEIVDTLLHRYQRNLRMFTDWDNEDVMQIYLTALAHVYDPHSDYFGHAQLESFAIGMNLSLFGIGAELTSEDGYCSIRRLLPEGPAEKSKKVNVKDRIVAVAQGDQSPVDVVDMRLDKAVQLIRGPKGTEVRLTIIPDGEPVSTRKVVTLIRDEIKLEDQYAKAKIIDLPTDGQDTVRLGVIDLPSFYATFDVHPGESAPHGNKSTSADVAKLLKKMKEEKVGGVILDLRRNGGGSLEEAIKLTGLFIKQGPVVQVRDSDGNVQEDADHDPGVVYDGPLVVLTSRFSASASEIVAGALQDYGRAVLVGDASTHGKGTVQSVNQLRPYLKLPASLLTNDPGALKLTIKKFYRATGASTQKDGVVPDIILPSLLNESKDIGEATLDNPLPWDKINPAKFDHLNRVEPYIAELRKRSAERVASDKDYAYIREDIEQFKKTQTDKTISLNERQRLKEKEEADARQKARDKERLSRKETQEKVYELTLRLAEVPGLPAPVAKTNSLAKASGSTRIAQGAASTNSAAVTQKPANKSEPDELAEDEKAPAVDVSLVEAEHILVDYLSVLPKPDVVTAGRAVN